MSDDFGYFNQFDDSEEEASTEVSFAEKDSGEDSGLPFVTVEADSITYRDLTGEKTFPTPPRRTEDKRKVGYYIRKSVAERLDMVARYLMETDAIQSKSELVEFALRGLLREVEQRGDTLIKQQMSNE